jgi:hypothetical protein
VETPTPRIEVRENSSSQPGGSIAIAPASVFSDRGERMSEVAASSVPEEQNSGSSRLASSRVEGASVKGLPD